MDGRVIAIDQQGGKSNCGYAEDVMMTLCSDSHGTPHALCYGTQMDERVICLQGGGTTSCGQQGGDGISDRGIAYTLNTLDVHGVCYSIEGHIVDRKTAQNGKGWAEGYAHTLNATDRHAVCYGVDCRNGVLDKEKTHTIQAKPQGGVSLNCTPSVCYVTDARGNGEGGGGTNDNR